MRTRDTRITRRLRGLLGVILALAMLLGMLPLPVMAEPGDPDALFTSVGAARYGTTYYIDAENGNDNNSGKSPDKAWKNLTKATETTFLPGDHILLRASSVWNGQILQPKGNGNAAYPIVIDMYELDGQDKAVYTADQRPILNGNGTESIGSFERYISAPVMLVNQEYWEVRNLEVTNSPELLNPEGYKKPGDRQRAGILILGYEQDRTFNHFVVKDCYVHDVQTEYYLKKTNAKENRRLKACGGIIVLGHWVDVDGNFVNNPGDHRSTTGFNDVVIEGNSVVRVGLEGIRTKIDSDTSVANTFHKTITNLAIRNNYLEDIAGDAIVLSETLGGCVVEGNVSKQACNADYGNHNYAAVWSMSNDNALFQYNEVYGIVYGYNDGEAYDIDMQCDGVIYQYNYSHHNGGGFLLLMGDQRNSIVRYNISANDGGGNRGTNADDGGGSGYTYKEQSIFHYWNKTDNANMPTIYNNTFYVGDGISTALFGEGNNNSNAGTVARFYNNILYKEGSGTLKFLTNQPTNGANPTERKMVDNPEHFFRNNIIWPQSVASATSGATPEKLATSGNLFVEPGMIIESAQDKRAELAAQNDTAFNPASGNIYTFTSKEALRARASLFQIAADSPAAGAGTIVSTAPEEDFFGNSIVGVVPDIGAHQVSDIPYRTEVDPVAVEVSTLAGIYPALPRTAEVTFRDIRGSETSTRVETRNITWEVVPAEKYTTAGSFIVEGAIEGVADVKATATVTVTGSSGSGDFERSFAANDAAFIQRTNGDTAYGAQQGAVGNPSSGSLNALKHPYGRSFSNNYVLKIKSATDGGYNRRFLIKFDVDDFDGSWSDVKNASIRLYIARYDSWNGLGGNEQNQVNNTAFIMDVYANEPNWTSNAVTWNNAPLNADVNTYNHVGIGGAGEQIPDYKQLQPVSHKEYINKDIIANGHAIDIDVSDYIRGLGSDVTEVSFLCDIPMSNISGFNKDNSGFDAFSALGAAAAWQDYQDGNLTVPAGVELTGPASLAPQLIVSDIYEVGVDPIEVDTDLGVAPALPDTATLRYSNGSTRTLGVTWYSIDPALYNTEGSFQARGYSSATNVPIVATVNVKADHITGFRTLPEIDTFVGFARNQLGLANSVVADLESGNYITVPIVGWDDDANNYDPDRPGSYSFPAVLGDLPQGVTNPAGLKAQQTARTHPKPTGVELDEAAKAVDAGGSVQFTGTVLCEEPNPNADEWSGALEWSITAEGGGMVNEEHISIDQTGLVTTTASAPLGRYTVTAVSLRNNTLSASAVLTLNQPEDDAVLSVTVAPAIAGVAPGATQQFTANVSVTGSASQEVTWGVAGNNSEATTVVDGLLTVAEDETAESLTVTATSIYDPEKSGVATVTVVNSPEPAVIGVVISPTSAEVLKGATQAFTAEVEAVNGASEEVVWSVSGNSSEATTVVDGLLTVAEEETAEGLTVTVTSVFDISKAASASVTVLEEIRVPTVASVQAFEPILKPVGTAQNALGLPTSAQVTLKDGSTVTLSISGWGSDPAYSPDAEGRFYFSGELYLGTVPGLVNPDNLEAEVEVGLVRAADKAILGQAISYAEAQETENLIPSKKEKFDNALAAAKATYEKVDATQEEIQQAYANLTDAIWDLGYVKADKTALNDLIAQMEQLDLSGYTETSANAFRAALQAAKAIAADEELSVADQQEVDDAAAALQEAFGNLEPASSGGAYLAILELFYNLYKDYDAKLYTPESWAPVGTALANAKAILESPDSYNDAQIDAATLALLNAVRGLAFSVQAGPLAEVIAVAEAILQEADKYVPVRVEKLREELKKAKDLLASGSYTEQDIVDQALSLLDAIHSMLEKGDKRALQALADSAARLSEKLYTADSWKVMQDALAEARKVLANSNAIDEMLQDAYDALYSAITRLVPKANTSALETAIAAAQVIVDNIGKYIPTTVAGLADQLAAAKQVLANPNATNEQVEKAANDLMSMVVKARRNVDKNALKSALGTSGRYSLGGFNQAAVQAVEEAQAAAQRVLDNENATLADVVQARDDLNNALLGLYDTTPAAGNQPVVTAPAKDGAGETPAPEVTAAEANEAPAATDDVQVQAAPVPETAAETPANPLPYVFVGLAALVGLLFVVYRRKYNRRENDQ